MVRYLDINQAGNSIKCKLFCEAIREIEHLIIFAHGFGGHKDNKAAERFAETALSKMKKTAVLVFDWPCHGTDVKKKLTLEDCDSYLGLVIDYAGEQLKAKKISAYGTSFGGYLLLKYVHEHGANPFGKIALRCPAVDMGEVMYKRVMTDENKSMLERGREVMVGFDRKVLINQEFMDKLMAADIRKWEYFDYADDILILHGSKDEIVPIEECRHFAEDNVIEFIEIEDADHRFQDLNKMKLAHSYMVDFINKK